MRGQAGHAMGCVAGGFYPATMIETLVAGEPAETLLEVLQQIGFRKRSNSMTRLDACLEPRLGDPLYRALLRVQAKLLLQDADAFGKLHADIRTHEQRAADALGALVLRVSDALPKPQ